MKKIKTILFILLVFNKALMAQVNFTYANLKFKINPSVKYIDGNVTYYFICQAPTDTLTMNFNSNLSIDSIVYHNQTISNFFYTPPDYIHIILPQNSAFIVDSISIIYHGIPNTTGLGSFNQTSHNASPIINTLSQPYGASDWMPSVNNLKDKIDSLKIQIACPIGFKAIANGLLVQSSTTNNESTFIYKHHYPIATYLIALSVTNYVEHTQQFIGTNYSMPIKNYVYPEDDIDWMNGAQHLPNVLRLFDSLFGDYPFKDEQYGMAQINYGGGMEHQTITFMGNYNHEISAHELAHHWFGNKVTCASWHDLWLNEGFATYLSGIAYQYSGTGFYWKPFLSGRMNSTMGEPDGSVYIDDTTSISRMFDGRLTYNKAAMVLHQLRYIIGDSAFFQACRNYLNDASLAFQFATTNDLKLHLESASGLDLDYYFDQWIYGQGYPVYSIALTNNGGNSYNISINYNTSSQVTTTFKLPVPIKFIGVNNDTIIKFFCENQSENFTIQLPFVPTQFICDPNLDIIARSNASVDVVSVQKSSRSVVFPIVSKDIFNISCNEEFTKYELFSLDGQLLSSGNISKGIVNKINIENFPRGLYLLKLISNRQSELFKIIKE